MSGNPARFAIPTKLNNMRLNSQTFESLDSTASLFKSQDFLNSLNAYKESMAKAGGESQSQNDPSAFFRSADFLRSLDTLPKERKDTVFQSVEFLQSLDFTSTDGKKLGKDIFASMDGKKNLRDVFSSRDWASEHAPEIGETVGRSLFSSQDSIKMDPMEGGRRLPPKKAGLKDYVNSREWTGKYETGHVDIPYSVQLFRSTDSTSSRTGQDPPGKTASSSTGSGKSKTSKWMKMYQDGLDITGPSAPAPAPLNVPAAAAMPPLMNVAMNVAAMSMPAVSSGGKGIDPNPSAMDASGDDKPAAKKPKKKRIYKSRKVIPEVKTFVEFTDDDVLLGRGGLSNKHPGNKRYRTEIENAKAVYRAASKDEKTEWANLLVEYVKKYGGRFLEKDKETGKWYIVPDVVARRKAGQALREDNTAESRKEKRDRYKKAHGKL